MVWPWAMHGVVFSYILYLFNCITITQVLKRGHVIKDFKNCDFQPIKDRLDELRDEKKVDAVSTNCACARPVHVGTANIMSSTLVKMEFPSLKCGDFRMYLPYCII